MTMGRIALAFSAFALLLLLGCFTPNMNGPCCKLADALKGTCNLYTQPGPDDPPDSAGTEESCNGNTLSNGLKCTTRFCALANSTSGRNETVYIKYTASGYSVLDCTNYSPSNSSHPCNNIGYCFINAVNASAPDQSYNYSVPICTERSEMGIDTDCKTMLCGNIKYSPQHSFLPEPAKNPMYQNLGSSYTINLYNAMCNFYTLDNKTMKKLKKGSGIFVNSYRFGIGESISDFEEGRYYFPLSDRWCGFVPDLPGAAEDAMCSIRDRYMNYLNLSAGAGASYTQTHVSGSGSGQLCTDELIYVMVDYKSDGAHLLVTDTAYNSAGLSLEQRWWHDNCQANNPSFIGGKGPSSSSGNFPHVWHELEVLPGHFEPGSLTLSASFSSCGIGSASTTGDAVLLPGRCDASGAQSGTFSYSYDGYRLDFSGDPRRFDPCTLNNRSVCSQDGNLDFAPAPNGQYVMTTFTEGTGQFATSYVMPANRFYKETLLEAYLSDVSGIGSTEMMDFECSNSGDCLSGLCMKEDSGYERSFCVDSGGLKNCLCYEVGMRTRPGNAVYCEPYMVNDTWGIERAKYASADGTVKDADPIVFFANKSQHGNATGEAYMNENNFTQTFLYRACHPQYSVAAGEGGQKINISDLGTCRPDDGVFGLAIDSFPKLDNTYGWCDSCTLATMVGIDLDYYFKKYQRVIPSTGRVLPYAFSCPATTCNKMQGIAVGVMDDMGGCELCGKKVTDYVENLALLRNRVDNYHKAGVIPVVWYVNGTLDYAETQSGTYETYHNCRIRAQDIEPYVGPMAGSIEDILLGNYFYYAPDASPFFEDASASCTTNRNPRKYDKKIKCPSPITASGAESNYDLGEFGSSGSGDSYSGSAEGSADGQAVEMGWWSYNVKHMTCNWTGYYHFLGRAIGNSASIVIIGTDDMDPLVLRNRSIMLKEQGNCPNCLAAVYSSGANITKLTKALGCNSPYSCAATNVPAGYYVDAIVYDFRANDAAGADREKAILDASTGTSRALLATFGKPSFPYNFVIDDSANDWEIYNDTLSAMKYLLDNQTDLVNSGQFALFYKKWFRNDNESLVTPMAGSSGRPPTFKDPKFCAIQKAINIYLNPIKRKTLINEIATVANTSDEARCVKCTDTEIQFGQCNPACENGVECTLPAGAVSHDGYRCQFNTAVEPCRPCASYGSDAKLSCTYTYPDDSTSTALFTVNQLSELYGDIIASMPNEQKCCLSYLDPQTNQTYNYTYSKSVGEGMTVTPVRFPKSGNESLDCGLNKDSDEFCGVQLPIKDYLIECKTG